MAGRVGCTDTLNGLDPLPVNVAVIGTPSPTVPDLLGACAEVGVLGAVILSSGFKEMDLNRWHGSHPPPDPAGRRAPDVQFPPGPLD
jgi:hypothetical protein